MTTPLAQRLVRLEQRAEEQRRPIRDTLGRVMDRLGVRLSPSEIEAMVTRHVGTPDRMQRRIQQLQHDGLSADEIFDHLTCELGLGAP
jgi:hypothetical protein